MMFLTPRVLVPITLFASLVNLNNAAPFLNNLLANALSIGGTALATDTYKTDYKSNSVENSDCDNCGGSGSIRGRGGKKGRGNGNDAPPPPIPLIGLTYPPIGYPDFGDYMDVYPDPLMMDSYGSLTNGEFIETDIVPLEYDPSVNNPVPIPIGVEIDPVSNPVYDVGDFSAPIETVPVTIVSNPTPIINNPQSVPSVIEVDNTGSVNAPAGINRSPVRTSPIRNRDSFIPGGFGSGLGLNRMGVGSNVLGAANSVFGSNRPRGNNVATAATAAAVTN